MPRSGPVFPIFVGHIPPDVTISDLRNLFSRCGTVLEVTIVAEHGFVNFDSHVDALEAIQRYNGHLMNGRPLHVDFSDELAHHLRRELRQTVQFTRDPWSDRRTTPPKCLLPQPVASRGRSPSRRYSRGEERRPHQGQRRSRSPVRESSSIRWMGSDDHHNRRSWGDRRSRSPGHRFLEARDRFSTESVRTYKSSGKERHREDRRSMSPQPSTSRTYRRDKSRSPTWSTSFSERLRAQQRRVPVQSDSMGPDYVNDKTHKRRRVNLTATDNSLSPVREDSLQVKIKMKKKDVCTTQTKTLASSETADLRAILDSRKQGESKNDSSNSSKIQIRINSHDESREIKVDHKDIAFYQELYIGNLFKDVEKSDIERLLSPYGTVRFIDMRDTYGLVKLDCTVEDAEKAIQELDRSLWMDNNIRVKFNQLSAKKQTYSKRNSGETLGHSNRLSDDQVRESETRMKRHRIDTRRIDSFLKIQREERLSEQATVEPKAQSDRKVKLRTFMLYSNIMPKTFLNDMTEVFSRFGQVESCLLNPDGQTLSIGLISSERRALSCIHEANNIRYKGGKLRVKFLDGMEENSSGYRRKHLFEFQNYPDVLIPHSQGQAQMSNQSGQDASELPIGVLPPSSSLGAFGAVPGSREKEMLKASMFSNPISNDSVLPDVETNPYPSIGPQAPRLTDNPQYASSVEGEIHSVHNKLILVNFFNGYSFQLAKFIPGQMYINGKTSLGFVIKNNTFHTWPKSVKSFLCQGSKVKMDVRKMTEMEIADAQEITSQYVMYSTPLVWKSVKPSEYDITISGSHQRMTVMKGIVRRLYPRWGILEVPHTREEIFFKVENYFQKTSVLEETDSLLKFLTVGDVVGAQASPKHYLEMAEIVRQIPGFESGTEKLTYLANLIWQIGAEVDPFAHKRPKSAEGDIPEFDFLTTSSTLNTQLPSDKDAQHKNWLGVIEEIHLPAGGIILLDESLGLDISHRRVYFHRSRIYLNGTKVTSNSSLDEELVIGDPVNVDVTPNQDQSNLNYPPYVFSDAYWVALSVQLNTSCRGPRIAQALRVSEEDETSKDKRNVCKGRIIHFDKPSSPTGPVTSGVAVIDSGPYAGQRVEFERSQCQGFGFPLSRTDLSLLMSVDEIVNIQLKPYNSFCIEHLYIGFKSTNFRESGLTPDERYQMKDYLASHGLDFISFDNITKGKFNPRPFIPLKAPAFKARIRSVKSTRTDRAANILVLSVDVGSAGIISMEAERKNTFIFGHWMGKADLNYVLEDEEVYVEYAPSLISCQSDGTVKASLVWLGGEDDRPYYKGKSCQSEMSRKMDASLWTFVRSKNMDEKMFRALAEGRLPPKEPEINVTTEDGNSITLDKETLAQATLLKQMKTSFGADSCLKAMMMLMGKNVNDPQFHEMKRNLESMNYSEKAPDEQPGPSHGHR